MGEINGEVIGFGLVTQYPVASDRCAPILCLILLAVFRTEFTKKTILSMTRSSLGALVDGFCVLFSLKRSSLGPSNFWANNYKFVNLQLIVRG